MTTPKLTRLVSQVIDIAVASPQVIVKRLDRMVRVGCNPSAKDMREFIGMGTEKALAVQQAGMAMLVEIMKARKRRIVSPADVLNITLDVLNEGLTPLRKKVVSNANRLSRD